MMRVDTTKFISLNTAPNLLTTSLYNYPVPSTVAMLDLTHEEAEVVYLKR